MADEKPRLILESENTKATQLFLKREGALLYLKARDPHGDEWYLVKITPEGVSPVGGLPQNLGIEVTPHNEVQVIGYEKRGFKT